jgi:aryl-alcohol dehydrogenase-like predicted oxidoreductase
VEALTRGRLGTTELQITSIGLGAWAIGGGGWQGGWGGQSDDDSVSTIHRAVELGLNWIDTAPAYGLGRAETVVGTAVHQLPASERPLIFTKCGLVWEPGATTVSNSLAPDSIRRECEASLRRLRCETIDLLQAHWPTWDDTPIEDSWATMAELVTEGKVRHIGLSNFDVDALERCERVRHVDTLQPELNLISRDAAADRLPWCAEHGTGVLAYSPMRSGLLTGAFSAKRVEALPADDWRATHEDFVEPKRRQNLALVDRLRPIANRCEATLSELSVAWVTSWPQVTAAIVGARRPEQIDDWIRAAEMTLDDETLADIATAISETGAGRGPAAPGGRTS